jgi:hypothetical protein
LGIFSEILPILTKLAGDYKEFHYINYKKNEYNCEIEIIYPEDL